jgi:hypothetical protein
MVLDNMLGGSRPVGRPVGATFANRYHPETRCSGFWLSQRRKRPVTDSVRSVSSLTLNAFANIT